MLEVESIAMKAGYPGAETGGYGETGGQPDGGGSQTAAGRYVFRPIEGQTRFLKTLLIISAVVGAVSVASSLMQLELLSRASFSQGQAMANDLRERLIGLAQMGLFVVTAIVFGCWIVRAQKNVRALGAEGLAIGPGWSLGYFFVPILCLWKPYQAMKDLWLASHNPRGWRGTTAPSLLGSWWGLWIISSLLGQVAFRLSANAQGLDGVRTATYVQIGAGVLEVLLCLAAMRLICQIGEAQTRQAASRAGGADVHEDDRCVAAGGAGAPSWRTGL